MELTELLKQPEGKALEYKRDFSSPIGVLRSVVAFANSAGGAVVIGVEDGTRHVRGVPDPVSLEERVVNVLQDGIAPQLLPEIEILPWRKTHVVVIRVHPSPGRPHFLRGAGVDAGTYVRVGSTNRRADAESIAEMRRASRGVPFDEQPLPDLPADAVDFQSAVAAFAAVRKLRRADLATLRLLVPYQGRTVPSAGGLLLFGRDRASTFPDAWIQAGRFAGRDRTGISDSARFDGPLPEMAEAAIAFVRRHSSRAFEIGAVRRSEHWSLPPVAVREAVVNAIVHADYAQHGAPIRISVFDDRLEVESPGLLAPGLTVDDLRRGVSKLRNRVIGRVFHELGLIEQWGSGISRMTAACTGAGHPPPDLEEIGTRFRVTLWTARGSPSGLDAIDQAIVDLLADGRGRSTQEIADRIARSSRASRTRLIGLIGRGLVRDVGSSPQDPNRRYFKAID